jgi:hypothetical protein
MDLIKTKSAPMTLDFKTLKATTQRTVATNNDSRSTEPTGAFMAAHREKRSERFGYPKIENS